MELISPLLRNDFREFCVIHFVLRQIRDIFTMAEIATTTIPEHRQNLISGERRMLVEQYYSSLDWTSPTDSDKFLKTIGYALAQSFLEEKHRNTLHEMCNREGYTVNGIIVSQPANQSSISEKSVKERASLFETLRSLFSLDDLKQLCFLYQLAQYEDLKGETISEKARELIQHCERREQLDRLVSIIKRERPNAKF